MVPISNLDHLRTIVMASTGVVAVGGDFQWVGLGGESQCRIKGDYVL